MSIQVDKDLSQARELKARFDQGKMEFRFVIPAFAFVAVASIVATLDPFGWFAGSPSTGPARQQIRMACLIITLWIPFAWFLLLRPLQTGVVVDYRKSVGKTTAVLRADEPSRFWFIYCWGALLLAGMLALGVYCLMDGLRELRKSTPAMVSNDIGASGAEGGFLFSTFRDETTPMSEQIYFGISVDGRHWEALNGGNPVLVSDVGEKGVRDSFILRAHDGQKVWLMATDLCVHRNRDWHRNTHAGSRSIVVWEASDLVHWSSPRLAVVAPDDAGCAWAPEAIYDEEAGDYLLYWASTTGRDNYSKQRIWAAHTKDFRSFEKPFVLVEKENHVIDIDIVRDGATYYRFMKDDEMKSVGMAFSKKLTGPWREMRQFTAGQGKNFEGPICYRLKATTNGQAPGWSLLLDNVSDRIGRGAFGYMAFISNDLSTGRFTPAADFHFPYPFRHGSVLPITTAERERLESAYPDPQKTGSISQTIR